MINVSCIFGFRNMAIVLEWSLVVWLSVVSVWGRTGVHVAVHHLWNIIFTVDWQSMMALHWGHLSPIPQSQISLAIHSELARRQF